MAMILPAALARTAAWAALLCSALADAVAAGRKPVVWGLDLGDDNM